MRGLCFVRGREHDRVPRAPELRTVERFFRVDTDREEAAQPFPAGHSRPARSARPDCNLTCKFCQNWDISKSREIDTLADDATPLRIAEVASSSAAGASRSPTTIR